MSDTDKSLEIGINFKTNTAAVKESQQELDKLTNSGQGLATSVPVLEEATKAFVIATEKEYLAVAKAHAAVTAKIPVLQAAGKETAAFEAAQKNLAAALDTERAIAIATRIEDKALAAAQLEAAAAGGLSSTAMREMTVIARELANGNFSRLPGSVSILAQKFDLLGAILSPVGIGLMGAGVTAYFLYEQFAAAAESAAEFKKVLDAMPGMAGLLGQSSGVAEAMEQAHINTEGFLDGLKRSHDGALSINEVLGMTATLLKNNATAEDEIAKKQKERDLARLEFLHASGQLNDAQYIAAKAGTEQDFSASAAARKVRLDQAILSQTAAAAGNVDITKRNLMTQVEPAEEAKAAAELRIKTAETNLERARANAARANEAVTGVTVKDGIATKSKEPGLQERFESLSEGQRYAAEKFKTVGDYVNDDPSGNTSKDADADAIRLRIKLEEARALETNWQKQAESAKNELATTKAAAQKPAADLDALKKKITDLSTQSVALHKQVEEKKAALDTDEHRAEMERPIVAETEKFKTGADAYKTKPGKMLHDATAAAQRIQAHQGTNEDEEALKAIISAMAGNATDLPSAMATAHQAAHDAAYAMQLISRAAAAWPQIPGDRLAQQLEELVKNLEYRLQYAR